MKIALIGYGKMGRAVEAASRERGHTTGATVDGPDEWCEKAEALSTCDIAIEFSTPATAVENIMKCFDLGLPVVSGTTGWHDRLAEVADICKDRGQALFVASNFSIGMNIMFELNRRLAELMEGRKEYSVSINETHHIHKLDAPSGTAITLADDIIARQGNKKRWQLTHNGASACSPEAIAVTAVREGEVPGIHEVVYDSAVDTLTLRHEAKSRKGLALGAVLAAEYLSGRKGFYTMRNLLGE